MLAAACGSTGALSGSAAVGIEGMDAVVEGGVKACGAVGSAAAANSKAKSFPVPSFVACALLTSPWDEISTPQIFLGFSSSTATSQSLPSGLRDFVLTTRALAMLFVEGTSKRIEFPASKFLGA